MSKVQLIIIDDVMEEFKKYLKINVKDNIDNCYGWNCDFICFPKGCPMKYENKNGWVCCGKCVIEYNCNNCGTEKFKEFLKKQNCRVEWLYPGQLGVWIQE